MPTQQMTHPGRHRLKYARRDTPCRRESVDGQVYYKAVRTATVVITALAVCPLGTKSMVLMSCRGTHDGN